MSRLNITEKKQSTIQLQSPTTSNWVGGKKTTSGVAACGDLFTTTSQYTGWEYNMEEGICVFMYIYLDICGP